MKVLPGILLLLLLQVALSTPVPAQADTAENIEDASNIPKVRKKRWFLPALNIGNLLGIAILPSPILPTNFIGLQVTLPAPKRRTSGRRRH